jgi:hypothetical protein
MTYDHTAYPTSRGEPQRKSTLEELTVWMNKMSASVGSNVRHHYDKGGDLIPPHIVFERWVDGKLVEKGVL